MRFSLRRGSLSADQNQVRSTGIRELGQREEHGRALGEKHVFVVVVRTGLAPSLLQAVNTFEGGVIIRSDLHGVVEST